MSSVINKILFALLLVVFIMHANNPHCALLCVGCVRICGNSYLQNCIVKVEWNNGSTGEYRLGHQGKVRALVCMLLAICERAGDERYQ